MKRRLAGIATLMGIGWLAPAALAQNAASDPAYFGAKLYPVLEAAGCRGCHVQDGVASATRLRFPESGASAARVQAFGLSLAQLVDRSNPSKSLLLNKPTARIQHTGGERIKPGSEEDRTLTEWVRYLSGVSEQLVSAAQHELDSSRPGGKPDEFVRRMTHAQYNNTVRDLLGDYSKPADRFPPEDYIDGFKNQLRTQTMPPLLVTAYSTGAEKLALNAFRAGDVNGLLPCKPVSANDAKCRDQFISSFGLKAFRRPLTAAEMHRYSAIFGAQAGRGSFTEGARAVVEAMLQSPKFLFHVEAGPGGRQRDYAIASRLAYLMWNTMPDKSLMDAAAGGELRTPEGIEKNARRMMDNPRARESLDEFFAEWMQFYRVLNIVKDRRRYPEFTPELAVFTVDETRRLLDHLVWDDVNFMEMLTADYGYLNSDLAALYKFPAPATEFQLMHFPADSRRAGLLGQASFLAANSGPVETSPTERGIFVREQLLCQHVPAPPPGVPTLPEVSAEKPQTKRQRMSMHAENSTCGSCHRLMDPIGFGMESFDAIGQWREKETVVINTATEGRRTPPKQFQLELDTHGEVAGIPNSAFSDPKDLGKILAGSATCQECIVRQVFRYAYGRMETPSDDATIHQLFSTFRDSGFRFKSLVLALVRMPQFLEGLEPAGPATAARNQNSNSHPIQQSMGRQP
jgi:hypothetical protein